MQILFFEGEPDSLHIGEVAEWLKAHAWKACISAKVSGVRIPSSPQAVLLENNTTIYPN